MESQPQNKATSAPNSANMHKLQHLLTNRQKATAFAEHLASVFHPFPSKLSAMEKETIKNELNAPHQMTYQ
jgi:hypothetical protein